MGCAFCISSVGGQRTWRGRHCEPGHGLSFFRTSQKDGPVSLCADSLLGEYEGRPSQCCPPQQSPDMRADMYDAVCPLATFSVSAL